MLLNAAVEFMWDTVIESVDRLSMEGEAGQGSGCILAHCMGLGKSLSVLNFHCWINYWFLFNIIVQCAYLIFNEGFSFQEVFTCSQK